MDFPEIEIKNLKISLVQLNQKHSTIMQIAYGENIIVKGVCVISVNKEDISSYFENSLCHFFQPNFDHKSTEKLTQAEAIVYRKSKYIKEKHYPSLFFFDYIYNEKNTYISELVYSIHFTRSGIRRTGSEDYLHVRDILDVYFKETNGKQYYDMSICDLDDDWFKIFNVFYKLVSLPKILVITDFELKNKKLESDFMEDCIHFSQDLGVIFIFFKKIRDRGTGFNCTSSLKLLNGQIISETYGNYEILRSELEFFRNVYKNNNTVFDSKCKCTNEFKENPKLKDGKGLLYAIVKKRINKKNINFEKLNKIIIKNQYCKYKLLPKEKIEKFKEKNVNYSLNIENKIEKIRIDNEKKEKIYDDQFFDTVDDDMEKQNIKEELDFLIKNKNFNGIKRKKREKNVFNRFFDLENYRMDYSDIVFIRNRILTSFCQSREKVCLHLSILTFFVILNAFFLEHKISINLILSFTRVTQSLINFFGILNDRKLILRYLLFIGIKIFELFIKPMFSDYFENISMDRFVFKTFGDKMITKYKINSFIIHTLIFRSIFTFGSYETNVIRRNIHILFSPGTYLMAIISCTAITVWIPVIIFSIIFGNIFPIFILLTSTFFILVFLTLRYYSYGFLRNDLLLFMFFICILYFNFLYPMYFEGKDVLFLHFTRKLNPIMIARDCDFMNGKLKWSFCGYCIRICVFMFLFCIYHLSKM